MGTTVDPIPNKHWKRRPGAGTYETAGGYDALETAYARGQELESIREGGPVSLKSLSDSENQISNATERGVPSTNSIISGRLRAGQEDPLTQTAVEAENRDIGSDLEL